MTRGEIWLVNLPRSGVRPGNRVRAYSVSPPEMHDHLRIVLVAPMTTGSRPAPFRIGIIHAGKKGLILLDQMRAIDKIR